MLLHCSTPGTERKHKKSEVAFLRLPAGTSPLSSWELQREGKLRFSLIALSAPPVWLSGVLPSPAHSALDLALLDAASV